MSSQCEASLGQQMKYKTGQSPRYLKWSLLIEPKIMNLTASLYNLYNEPHRQSLDPCD